MKKFFIVPLLFILLSGTVFAQELTNSSNRSTTFNFNAGNVGVAMNLPRKVNNDYELSLSVANFGLEFNRLRIGFNFSPFMTYFYNIGNDNSETDDVQREFSFINLSIYSNIVSISSFLGSNFFFGPFVQTSYMFMDETNKLKWDKYMFTAGVQMGFRATIGNFNYNVLSLEFGYRNINGTHNYHIGGKVDFITLFVAYLLSR